MSIAAVILLFRFYRQLSNNYANYSHENQLDRHYTDQQGVILQFDFKKSYFSELIF